MDFYKYAIEKIETCINEINTVRNNVELFQAKEKLEYSVSDALHAVADYYERLNKDNLPAEDDLYYKAFAYVNNQVKHDKERKLLKFLCSWQKIFRVETFSRNT